MEMAPELGGGGDHGSNRDSRHVRLRFQLTHAPVEELRRAILAAAGRGVVDGIDDSLVHDARTLGRVADVDGEYLHR